MARVDYFAIEQQIKTILDDDADVPNDVTVVVEEEIVFGKQPKVFIYLDRREAPADLQQLSAGTSTRFLLYFSIWCFHYAYEMREAIEKRDDLLGKVEIALMRERTLNATVDFCYLNGGEFQNFGGGGRSGFNSGAEIELVAQITGET